MGVGMKRLITLLYIALSLLLGLGLPACKCDGSAADGTGTASGNVFFFIIDTLRADHLGTFGYKTATSPVLDALAEDSIVFEDAQSTAPWTLPSISSMFTGTYPAILGNTERYVGIDKEIETITQLFKEKGYKTAAVTSHFLISEKLGFGKGFDRFDMNEGGKGAEYISSPGVTNRVIDFLRKHSEEKMFLFSHWFDPHYEYRMHNILNTYPDYTGRIGDKFGVHKIREMGYLGRLNESDLRYLTARYDSEIRFTDHHLGKVIQEIKRLGLYDDATIVVVADHGEELGEAGDGWIGHSIKVSRAVIRVPLMIKLPHGRHKRRVQNRVSLIDLGPTIAKTAGLRPLNGPSVSGKPWDLTEDIPTPEVIFSESQRYGDIQGVITGDWKLVFNRKSTYHEIYHLKNDPLETTNLINEDLAQFESLNQVRRDFERKIEDLKKQLKLKKEDVQMTPEQIQQLKALGYTQ